MIKLVVLEENGWVKYFSDGTTEIGLDSDPKASWSRGRLDQMIGASLHHNKHSVYLLCEDGETSKFWQSDDYEVVFGHNSPNITTRRIERKLGSKNWKILELDVKTDEVKEYTSRHKI